MRAKFMVLFMVISGVFLLFNSYIVAGEISESYPLPFLSFEKYQVVESSQDGDILTRKIKIEVTNTSDKTLYNVTAMIDSSPDFANCSGSIISLGNISPGEKVIADDFVEVLVDTAKQDGAELRLIWRIECDLNGEHILDETGVIEDI